MQGTSIGTQTEFDPQLKSDYINAVTAVKEAGELLEPVEHELADIVRIITEQHRNKYAEIYDIAASTAERLESSEKILRDAVIRHYKETGEKTIDENLSVRVNSRLEYENDEAVEWAEKNAPVMIYRTVDKKAFESYSQVTDLPFVKKIDTPSAVIKGLK